MAKPVPKLFEPELTLTPALFINRDMSLVEFYRRVLNEGLDSNQPILERVKFLSIFSSLIDEFFMVRMSGLQEKAWSKPDISPDGMTPADKLSWIRMTIRELGATQSNCFKNEIMARLEESGIVLVPYNSLAKSEKDAFRKYFQENLFPVLTPQAVDPTHPFPYISGGNLNIGLYIRPKLNKRVERALKLGTDQIFVQMKLPGFIPRLVPVSGRESSFVFMEELIAANIDPLVTDAETAGCHTFRITRDADIELRESEAADLLEMMEQNLRKRRFGRITRLEVSSSMPEEMVAYLTNELEIDEEDVFTIDGPVNLSDMSSLCKLNRPELKDAPIRVVKPDLFDENSSTFDLIKQGDIMLHHPYMPYSIVTDLIAEAADDPDVLAIKMCLYRLGTESPIPPLLIKASEQGKQVTVLIELKARFDESNNIEWAKTLEEAGVHVIYGLLGLKTHAKNTLIVRREGDRLRRYVHAATGNYNPQTSAAYTDLGLLTCDDKIGEDVSALFNFLTVYSQPRSINKLLIAPINLRTRMLELIGRETDHARNGRPARIIAKLNRLADSEIVQALYEASKAGVEIDLIVRGICTLRPGIPGISENIKVRSIVGRLLEHSRVYCFENGGQREVYMGSSDWMPRNLDRRVEVLTPVEQPQIRDYLVKTFLASYLRDNSKAHELQTDGSYQMVGRHEDDDIFSVQEGFQEDMGLFEHRVEAVAD